MLRCGLRLCILRKEGRPDTRSAVARGVPRTPEPPEFSHEQEAAHSIQVLKERAGAMIAEAEVLASPEIEAGRSRVIRRLQYWFLNGTLRLQSSAATELVKKEQGIQERAPCGVVLKPYYFPEERALSETPWYVKEMLIAAPKFR